MALFDSMFEFSDEQDISQAPGSLASTNILDFQAADLEMGAGTPLYLNVRVGTVAFTGGTTVQVILRADTDANQTGGTDVYLSEAFAVDNAETAIGAWLVRIPLDVDFDKDQYIYVAYTNVGANSAGKLNCWIDHGPQSSYDTQINASNI
jgi:hypothetical protein